MILLALSELSVKVDIERLTNMYTFPELPLLKLLEERHDLLVGQTVSRDGGGRHHYLSLQWSYFSGGGSGLLRGPLEMLWKTLHKCS